MRKMLPCLLLSGVLALSLAACAPGGEAPGPSQELSQPAATEAPSQPLQTAPPSEAIGLPPERSGPPAAELDLYELPDRGYQPWQTAYMGFLAELCRIDVGCPWDYAVDDVDDLYKGLAVDERGAYSMVMGDRQAMTKVMGMGSESYSLCDVDRDGVPELFVAYGSGGYIPQCYTYRDGEIACIGEFDTKDSSLYGHPEKDAVLRHGGRMGYYELYEYPMEDGRLTEGQVIFSEGPVDAGTKTEEIVPGAEPIDCFSPWLGELDDDKFHTPEYEGSDDGRPHPSVGKALLLPICDWYDGPAATGSSSERARTAILAALDGEAELYGASGDHYSCGDVGRTTWEEYIQPGAACPYNEQPLEVVGHAWLDMNGDGQEECLLRVVMLRGEDDGRPWANEGTVVLSEQDGTVYAYFFGIDIDESTALYSDGTFRNISGRDRRLSFWRDQCYDYAAQHAASASPVEWLDGPISG